jgi:GNAT superfamily N-acetyltransferase
MMNDIGALSHTDRVRVRVASAAEPLHAILADCGVDMRERIGLSHWIPPYPLTRLRHDVVKGNVYEVAVADETIATFTIDDDSPDYVGDVLWAAEGEPGIYVTRLAVRPVFQGRGIGSSCMEWIERHAGSSGARSVRLDAHSKHEALLRFYRRRGYAARGEYEAFATPLTCFEKVLNT